MRRGVNCRGHDDQLEPGTWESISEFGSTIYRSDDSHLNSRKAKTFRREQREQ